MSEEFFEEKIKDPSELEDESASEMNDLEADPVNIEEGKEIDEELAEEEISSEQNTPEERTVPIPIPLPTEKPEDEHVVSRSILYNAPMDDLPLYEKPSDRLSLESATLLERDESEQLRTRWMEIQARFVDEPRTAVQEADKLVTEVMETITRIFAVEYGDLESQWKNFEVASTEDLRKALQHYRAFFNRLVG